MERLPVEIFVMVLEAVSAAEWYHPDVLNYVPPLQRLRLVSRWFCSSVTPTLYRTRYLRARCLRDVDDRLCIWELANIRLYSKHLVMPDYHEMDATLLSQAAGFISSCHALEALKWHITSPLNREGRFMSQALGTVPAIILDALIRKIDKRVRVEIMRNSFSVYPQSDPESVGFYDQTSKTQCQNLTSQTGGILDLLDIDTLSACPLPAPFGTKFSPMKRLILRNYSWTGAPEEYNDLWDFSQLEFLRMEAVPITPFLSSVPLSDLSALRCLQIDISGWIDDEIIPRRERCHELFRVTAGLEELMIMGCWSMMIAANSLSLLKNLRVLRLTEPDACDDGRTIKHLERADLKQLNIWCPLLVGLELDFTLDDKDQHLLDFTQISRLTALQRLRLHIYYPSIEAVPPNPNPNPNLDPNLDPNPAPAIPSPAPTPVHPPPLQRTEPEPVADPEDPKGADFAVSHLRASKLGLPYRQIQLVYEEDGKGRLWEGQGGLGGRFKWRGDMGVGL